MQVDFRSDNVAGVAPEILDAIVRANTGTDLSYGSDAVTRRLQDRFSDLFGRSCYVQPVGTGTATNALSLALLTPPWGAVLCSEVAHIGDSECGAGELFTGGAKILGLPHHEGKLDPEALERALASAGWGKTSSAQPALLSLTQGTERGTVYTAAEIEALTAIARRYKLRVHMDGARFANAVAALGCAPGDITWRLGVDVLSFGATKNGCLGAEAIADLRREPGDAAPVPRPQGRPRPLEDALRLGPARGLSRGRPLAPPRRPTPTPWPDASPRACATCPAPVSSIRWRSTRSFSSCRRRYGKASRRRASASMAAAATRCASSPRSARPRPRSMPSSRRRGAMPACPLTCRQTREPQTPHISENLGNQARNPKT